MHRNLKDFNETLLIFFFADRLEIPINILTRQTSRLFFYFILFF